MTEIIPLNTIQELKRGSPKALREIYKLYSERIFFFINSYTHNKEISEELVQDVFLKLWNSRENLDVSLSVKSYIYSIAKNAAIDIIRKRKIKTIPLESLNQIVCKHENEGEKNILFEQKADLIERAVNSLSPRKKEIFKLSRYHKLTYRQIASRLCISVSAVEKSISSALKEIREYLSKKS